MVNYKYGYAFIPKSRELPIYNLIVLALKRSLPSVGIVIFNVFLLFDTHSCKKTYLLEFFLESYRSEFLKFCPDYYV